MWQGLHRVTSGVHASMTVLGVAARQNSAVNKPDVCPRVHMHYEDGRIPLPVAQAFLFMHRKDPYGVEGTKCMQLL